MGGESPVKLSEIVHDKFLLDLLLNSCFETFSTQSCKLFWTFLSAFCKLCARQFQNNATVDMSVSPLWTSTLAQQRHMRQST